MQVLLLRYSEIHLKGSNRGYFERTLMRNIKYWLKDEKFNLKQISGRYIISDYDPSHENAIIQKLTQVFGLHTLTPALCIPTSVEGIIEEIKKIKLEGKFRVTVNRASKIFPIHTIDFAAQLGEIVLSNNTNAKVDLHNPDTNILVDIRENGYTYIGTRIIKCAGGMPVSTAGKGLLLLSGGIDSPVAGFSMAKRGMTVSALHFFSFPYTSELAKQKVIDLATKLTGYLGDIDLYFISFTKVQEAIHRNCNNNYMITIMRRIMMRLAQKLSKEIGAGAIITGESLGQVASQTLESITSTNAVVNIPMFRPLISFDKENIIEIARKIDTFNISSLPYEDCCTVFLPKNPVIKPTLVNVEKEEAKLNIDELVEEAYKTLTKMTIKLN
ncbi:MAG: tRNA 4-thiouridine(8) synthase ThiI [Clostridia bacterium]|nr:tRNA 4-thiouridine(8) synthase ThiI [Clostridia bacterium]